MLGCLGQRQRARAENLVVKASRNTATLKRQAGGDGGIRTLDRALQPYNGLANRRLQPLGHISGRADMPDTAVSRKRQILGRRLMTGRITPPRLAHDPETRGPVGAIWKPAFRITI